MKRSILATFTLAFFLAPNLRYQVAAQSFEFPVEHQRALRNHRGTLAITPEGIEYRTDHKNESRSWRYQDIQQIKIESPTVLQIMTYEDQEAMLGRDRIFKFKLLEGKITPEVSALLMARATRPVATSVMPVTAGESKFETPVKHLHTFGGCEGSLKIYPDRVTYESADNPAHSRYWRYSDIQHFSHPGRYRFEITTFEDRFGGPTKVYGFQLKADLPAPAYDYVWVRVNPAELYPYHKAAGQDALAAGPQVEPSARPRSDSDAPIAEAAPKPPPAPEQADKTQVQTAGKDSPVVVEEVKPRRETPDRKARSAARKPAVQTAKVILTTEGYKPDSIRLLRGTPAQVTFIRQTDGTCGAEIVFPEYGIKRSLPLNKPVVVGFVPDRSGEFSFTCGMGMLRGKIVVQEK